MPEAVSRPEGSWAAGDAAYTNKRGLAPGTGTPRPHAGVARPPEAFGHPRCSVYTKRQGGRAPWLSSQPNRRSSGQVSARGARLWGRSCCAVARAFPTSPERGFQHRGSSTSLRGWSWVEGTILPSPELQLQGVCVCGGAVCVGVSWSQNTTFFPALGRAARSRSASTRPQCPRAWLPPAAVAL